MPDMYYIDLIQPKTGYIGASDYIATMPDDGLSDEYLGGPHVRRGGNAGRHRGGGSRAIPLFYTVDFGNVNMAKEPCIPDNVGAIAYPSWVPTTTTKTGADLAEWKNSVAFAQGLHDIIHHYKQSPNDTTAKARATRFASYATPDKALNPNNPFWQSTPTRIGDFGAIVKQAAHHHFSSKTAFNPMAAIGAAAGDAVHTMNSAAKLAGKALNVPGQLVSNIPVVGKPLKSALALNPVTAVGGLVSKVVSGERIDHAFINAAKGQIAAARDVAPYVQMVMSVVPGAGTGIASAIAIGTSLADGRSITDAVLAAAKAAVPGGAIGKAVFTAATEIAKGASITEAAMNTVLSTLPPASQSAARLAIAAAKGKNVREAALQAIRANLPADAKKALEIGTALGIARNVQSNVARELAKPAVLSKLVAATKMPPHVSLSVPKASAPAKGFKTAVALASHSGISATSLATARSTMTKDEQAGFDHGLKTYINAIAAPELGSLVRGGVVARGKWRPAKSGETGTPGRLVMNGQITHGNYVRES